MRLVIQRVTEASVSIDGEVYSQISKGFVIFVGISNEDTKEIADKYIEKLTKLRIFEDENGKTNLSLADVGGEVLMISQFTLYADCKKGNRPSFIGAGNPEMASDLYDHMCNKATELIRNVKRGVFGAEMMVSLVNEGPFTIILDESLM